MSNNNGKNSQNNFNIQKEILDKDALNPFIFKSKDIINTISLRPGKSLIRSKSMRPSNIKSNNKKRELKDK